MATGGNPHGAYRFAGNSSPGPAIPEVATAQSVAHTRHAPSAICSTTGRLTAPYVARGRLTDSEHSVLYIVAVGYDATHKHLGTAGDEG